MPSKIIREFRSGHVRLTVWEHEADRKSCTLARLYKNKSGRWQTTEGLQPDDLLDVVAVCLKANEFLRLEDRWPGLRKKEGLVTNSPAKKP